MAITKTGSNQVKGAFRKKILKAIEKNPLVENPDRAGWTLGGLTAALVPGKLGTRALAGTIVGLGAKSHYEHEKRMQEREKQTKK